jgi:opacity protein-like surface antigen
VKKFLVPAVLAVALVVPAQAVAKKAKHYTGTVTPAGTIGFKVTQKKHSKKKSVSGFSFAGIPVTCADGPHTTHGFVSFPVKLNKGRFNISASSTVTGAKLEIHGNLAAGTLQVSGDVPIDPTGQGTGCDSGVLGWTAHRG